MAAILFIGCGNWTTHHVALFLGVPERTVRHWARTGRLPARKRGIRAWIYEPAVVLRFRDEQGFGSLA